MAKQLKNFVLVSASIPKDFDVLALGADGTIQEGCKNSIRKDWQHRVYEVSDFGSLDGVTVTSDDRFIAQVQGYSLNELDGWPLEAGMIGDMRSWAGAYRIFTPGGDYVCIAPEVDGCCYRAFEPQQFGLSPFPTWDANVELDSDLTDQVFNG